MSPRLTRPEIAASARIRADLRSGAARERREATGLSAADVAKHAEVSRQSVSAWEAGITTPTIEHALAYDRAVTAAERKAA